MRHTRRIFPLAFATLVVAGCGKNAAPNGDSTVASSRTATFDENVARAQILGADSAFVRAITSKNVDSLMPVNFSNDHSMAWDYGTVSQTADVKGKPVKTSGTYLNVWKNVGGRWMIVAEISSTAP